MKQTGTFGGPTGSGVKYDRGKLTSPKPPRGMSATVRSGSSERASVYGAEQREQVQGWNDSVEST